MYKKIRNIKPSFKNKPMETKLKFNKKFSNESIRPK